MAGGGRKSILQFSLSKEMGLCEETADKNGMLIMAFGVNCFAKLHISIKWSKANGKYLLIENGAPKEHSN